MANISVLFSKQGPGYKEIMFSLVIKTYNKIALLGHMHYKYIRCNFYSFSLCLNFHCNLTIRFTSNCCSDYSWIIVKLKNRFFYCNFYIGLYKSIKCKLYSKITVESGYNGKTVHICSVDKTFELSHFYYFDYNTEY